MSATASADLDRQAKELKAERGFMGHPRAVGTLSWVVMCNSFANYGMSAVLVYYLYAQAPAGLGLDQMEAAQLITLYSACATLAGLVGSYVADRILGPRRALGLARTLCAVAYTLLAVPFLGIAGYAMSQVLLCVAGMCAGRSSEALTRKMYEQGDDRCDGAFGIQYVINNVGAAVPALVGTIAMASGYHAAFALCAVISAAGAAGYLLTQKKFFGPIGLEPDDPMPPKQAKTFVCALIAIVVVLVACGAYAFSSGLVTISSFANAVSTVAIFVPIVYIVYIIKSKKCTPAESRAVLYLVPLFICGSLTNVVFQQASSVLAVYAETSVDRNLFGMEVTPAIFSTLGAVFSIVFGAICTVLWTKLRKQPTTSAKMAFGSLVYGLSPLLMCLPFLLYPAGVKVSPMWLIGFWFVSMLGEAISCPVGYSLAAKVAPVAFSTQMVTVWGLQGSLGAGISTIITNFYHEGGEVPYFLLLGGVCVVWSFIVLLFSKKIERGMGLLPEGE